MIVVVVHEPLILSFYYRVFCLFSSLEVLEEVVAFVVDYNEGGEVLDLDLPDGLHAEFGILQHLYFPDTVLSKPCCWPSDRAQIETAVFLAS